MPSVHRIWFGDRLIQRQWLWRCLLVMGDQGLLDNNRGRLSCANCMICYLIYLLGTYWELTLNMDDLKAGQDKWKNFFFFFYGLTGCLTKPLGHMHINSIVCKKQGACGSQRDGKWYHIPFPSRWCLVESGSTGQEEGDEGGKERLSEWEIWREAGDFEFYLFSLVFFFLKEKHLSYCFVIGEISTITP